MDEPSPINPSSFLSTRFAEDHMHRTVTLVGLAMLLTIPGSQALSQGKKTKAQKIANAGDDESRKRITSRPLGVPECPIRTPSAIQHTVNAPTYNSGCGHPDSCRVQVFFSCTRRYRAETRPKSRIRHGSRLLVDTFPLRQ